jgi:hypothetical protein
MKRRMLRRTFTAFLALSVSGCMGQFALTRALLGFNNSITSNGIVNHLIFWALLFLLPIYELAVLGDLFILNVIEFWTGKNLLAEMKQNDDGSVRVVHNNQPFSATQVSDKKVVVSNADGPIGSVEELDTGAILIRNGKGEEVFVVEKEEVEMVERALNVRGR